MISNRSTQAINLKAIGQLFPLGLTLAVFVGKKEKNKLIQLCDAGNIKIRSLPDLFIIYYVGNRTDGD